MRRHTADVLPNLPLGSHTPTSASPPLRDCHNKMMEPPEPVVRVVRYDHQEEEEEEEEDELDTGTSCTSPCTSLGSCSSSEEDEENNHTDTNARRVRFRLNHNHIHIIALIPEQYCSDVFYTRAEILHFKQTLFEEQCFLMDSSASDLLTLSPEEREQRRAERKRLKQAQQQRLAQERLDKQLQKQRKKGLKQPQPKKNKNSLGGFLEQNNNNNHSNSSLGNQDDLDNCSRGSSRRGGLTSCQDSVYGNLGFDYRNNDDDDSTDSDDSDDECDHPSEYTTEDKDTGSVLLDGSLDWDHMDDKQRLKALRKQRIRERRASRQQQKQPPTKSSKKNVILDDLIEPEHESPPMATNHNHKGKQPIEESSLRSRPALTSFLSRSEPCLTVDRHDNYTNNDDDDDDDDLASVLSHIIETGVRQHARVLAVPETYQQRRRTSGDALPKLPSSRGLIGQTNHKGIIQNNNQKERTSAARPSNATTATSTTGTSTTTRPPPPPGLERANSWGGFLGIMGSSSSSSKQKQAPVLREWKQPSSPKGGGGSSTNGLWTWLPGKRSTK